MLKKVKIGEKDVPVPVPLLTLEDAVCWVEETLCMQGTYITRISLGNKNYTDDSREKRKKINLLNDSNLEIQVETPKELALETINAIRNLSFGLQKTLDNLSVQCWQSDQDFEAKELRQCVQDLGLILELIGNLNGILDYSHVDMAAVNGLAILVDAQLKKLLIAQKKRDWKECAHFLLNRLGPFLKELVIECENLQLNLYTHTNGPLLKMSEK